MQVLSRNTCKVIKAYSSAYPNPLMLRKGAIVTISEKDCEWDGWLWCSDSNDLQGWVRKSYVDIDGDSGRMLRDYNATELSVTVGENIEVLAEESGWLQCQKSDGKTGWIPSSVARIIQE
jgi:SH3-like domain-containing protein